VERRVVRDDRPADEAHLKLHDDSLTANRSTPLDEWMEARVGKPADEVTISDLQNLPRIKGLRYGSLESKLGGRLESHLLHLEEQEAAELAERGDRFLEETPDESEGASEPSAE
jgi:hypothetical protein